MASLHRPAVDEFVVQEAGEHVVARFDETHRGLATDGERAAQLAGRLGPEDCRVRGYTREQLGPRLKLLLEKGVLREKYRPIARLLLEACARSN